MAVVELINGVLTLQLSGFERIGALHPSFQIPLEHVTSVRVSDTPNKELRGLRAPGTGVPRVVLLGTWRSRQTKDFAAIYRNRPSLVLELHDEEFDRVVVSVDQPEQIAERLGRELQSPSA